MTLLAPNRMIAYRITAPEGLATVRLASERLFETSELHFEGDPAVIVLVKTWLQNIYGTSGRTLGRSCRPADLAALFSEYRSHRFTAQLVRGLTEGSVA